MFIYIYIHIYIVDWTDMPEHQVSISNSTTPPIYVNLLDNPERYTGYSGPSARRVWDAIMEENCFGDINDVCLEKRLFYRYLYLYVYVFVCVSLIMIYMLICMCSCQSEFMYKYNCFYVILIDLI